MADNDNDTIEAPCAHTVQVFSCDECVHPHIVLFAADGTPLAQAVLPDSTLAILARWPTR